MSSSSLTYQLRQQKEKEENKLTSEASLPSPPSSSCGDEATLRKEGTGAGTAVEDGMVVSIKKNSIDRPEQSFTSSQWNSLLQPTHFNEQTLERFSTSLPENYTIDHSSPVPIHTLRKPSQSPYARSPSSTAAAASTGGITIRHGKPFDPNKRKNRGLSESPIHRCGDCGKMYKHPNCLVKHRWEHSEEWELTSKLLLTKHQQVQMLEAAAILVGMDTKRLEQQQEQQVESHSYKSFMDIDDDVDDDADADVDPCQQEDDDAGSLISVSTNDSSPTILPASFPEDS
ncbi:hypothetical protein DFQ28_000811 [Apophysomyces sp. BC1034]|nr:hypothetical protein DFQ30_000793 [Apophysomyces sp. BC1015]KAG0177578.1 hypothetical protein DFQ29_004676 [Apophysomyces sp. BC1021]KAG0191157.1 hypothetical protein DFQ28_000811 [Apophysomyces sp. BC1034]